jgi:protein SCO1/2
MQGIGLPTLALLAAVGAGEGPPPSRLAVIRQAPDSILTTQDGETQRFADLRGKVLLVSFVFTTCNGTCPATTHRMSQVQQELKARRLEGDGVRLLSITLDPARDTPEVLRGYMRLYDVDAKSWTFLTGPPEQVGKAVAAWGMWARPAANGQLDHPSRIHLVDPKGRIREIYNLSFMKPQWVAEDIDLLLKEAGARRASAPR